MLVYFMHMYPGAISQSCDYFGRCDILTKTDSRLRLFFRCDIVINELTVVTILFVAIWFRYRIRNCDCWIGCDSFQYRAGGCDFFVHCDIVSL